MSNWTKESIEEAVNKVSEKAAKDVGFRKLCTKDIHTAIKETMGKEIPQNVRINVVDNTGFHLSVTLPPLKRTDGELSESELESVAGGSKEDVDNFFGSLGFRTGEDFILHPSQFQ